MLIRLTAYAVRLLFSSEFFLSLFRLTAYAGRLLFSSEFFLSYLFLASFFSETTQWIFIKFSGRVGTIEYQNKTHFYVDILLRNRATPTSKNSNVAISQEVLGVWNSNLVGSCIREIWTTSFGGFLLRYVVGQRSFLKIATYVYRKN